MRIWQVVKVLVIATLIGINLPVVVLAGDHDGPPAPPEPPPVHCCAVPHTIVFVDMHVDGNIQVAANSDVHSKIRVHDLTVGGPINVLSVTGNNVSIGDVNCGECPTAQFADHVNVSSLIDVNKLGAASLDVTSVTGTNVSIKTGAH